MIPLTEDYMSDPPGHALSAEELNAVFRHSPAAVIISRWTDRTIVDVNESFTDLFGWTRAEAIGRKSGELLLLDPQVSLALRAQLEGLIELRDQQLMVRTRNGDNRDVIMGADLIDVHGERHAVTTFIDITARQQVQRAMTRLAAIVESSDDAIISKDLNGVVMSWNPGAQKIFGYSAAEMIGSSILRIIPEDLRDEEAFILSAVKRGVGVTNLETRRRRKDGSVVGVSVTTSPIRDATGTVTGVSKIARDVTEYRRAEEARRASEASYRALFEHAPDGILIADGHGRYLDANPAICRMLGYEHDELVGRSAADIVAPEETQYITPAIDTITGDGGYHREWQFRRKDGSAFVAEVIGALMPDGTLMAMIRDVTARHRIEARFRRLVESNAQGVCFWRGSTVTEANDAFLHIIGGSREELIAGRIDLAALTPPEYAEADRRVRAV
jgi:PAS domain S-box-containing protein